MKSTRNELRAKVNNLIEELDLSELTKEPTFKNLEDVINFIDKNKIVEVKDHSECPNHKIIIVKASDRIFEYLNNYHKELIKRGYEWRRKSDSLFSKLLVEETGMQQEDIDFIKQPICLYGRQIYEIDNLSNYLNQIGIDVFLACKNKYLPIQKLKYEYGHNQCEDISALYQRSLENLTDIFGLEVAMADWIRFGENILKKVIIPSTNDIDLKLRENELNKSINENDEKVKNYAESEVKECKEEIVRNIGIIDSIYSIAKKENGSIKKGFEKEIKDKFGK